MSQHLFKAVTRYRLDERTIQLIEQLAARPHPQLYNRIERILAKYRADVFTLVTDYLEEQGRAGDLLNLYLTLDRNTWIAAIALTFSNRDTALMLKLAIM